MKLDEPVEWIWSFVGNKPLQNHFKNLQDYPSKSPESEALSKALQKVGFNFVGSTTMYAYMQAVGMVDDHSTDCFRRAEMAKTES